MGCSHYKRGCTLKAKCCEQFWGCRKCHDEASDDAGPDLKGICLEKMDRGVVE
jgi:uncharacterized CHY-type Zn-finger protein